MATPLQQLAARLADLLDEDQFAECEALLIEAGARYPDEKTAANFSDALSEGRKKHNMTLDKASAAIGISKSYLWSLERGESEPSLWIASKIADLYGLDLKSLAELPRVDLGELAP